MFRFLQYIIVSLVISLDIIAASWHPVAGWGGH